MPKAVWFGFLVVNVPPFCDLQTGNDWVLVAQDCAESEPRGISVPLAQEEKGANAALSSLFNGGGGQSGFVSGVDSGATTTDTATTSAFSSGVSASVSRRARSALRRETPCPVSHRAAGSSRSFQLETSRTSVSFGIWNVFWHDGGTLAVRLHGPTATTAASNWQPWAPVWPWRALGLHRLTTHVSCHGIPAACDAGVFQPQFDGHHAVDYAFVGTVSPAFTKSEALEISAQNAARQARQGPIQWMPSRALDGSQRLKAWALRSKKLRGSARSVVPAGPPIFGIQ